MTITLQVGKRYVMRNGEVTGVMRIPDPPHYLRDMAFTDEPGKSHTCNHYWCEDGMVYEKKASDCDCISEYHESPAVDPLTGMPAVYGVPMIETGPVFKVGDRVMCDKWDPDESDGAVLPRGRPEMVGVVQRICEVTPSGMVFTGPETMGKHRWRSEWLRPATPAEIAAADRPVERVKQKVWINRYRTGETSGTHYTRTAADDAGDSTRIACICLDIDIPEGTGLQGQEFVVRVSK